MRGEWSRSALAVGVVGLVLVAVAVVAVVTDPRPRLAATNSEVLVSGVALTVAPGEDRCQDGEFVPDEVARLRVYTGTVEGSSGEPLLFSIFSQDGDLLSRRRVPGGYPPGPLDVPVEAPPADLDDGELCVRNLGNRPMSFAGNLTLPDAVTQAQQAASGAVAGSGDDIRVDFFRPGGESLWALSSEVARRFALFKPSFTGSWTMWAVLVSVALMGVAAVLLVVRQPSTSAEHHLSDEQR
ncbi:MAG: hypothetical protein M3507_03325 [Actinomycetota bacterium]|nr:hypothetical protein [Actinomycetota bacterium]